MVIRVRVGALAVAAPTPVTSQHRVVVVVGDYIKVSVPDSGKSLRMRVVEPMQADILMLLMNRKGDPTDEATARARFAALEPIVHLELREDPSINGLAQMLIAHPDFPYRGGAGGGSGKCDPL